MTPILGPARATVEAATRYAAGRAPDAPGWFTTTLPATYWRLAPLAGIRPEVAYAQAIHETGFGRFGRAVTPEHHNYCGLKVRNPGADHDPDSHARFPTLEVGVIAHLDHLALYAAAPGYPRHDTPDPRHFASILGAARTVEDLGGEDPPDGVPDWAPSPQYPEPILRHIAGITALVWT
jgi:N-acetylmuramoyl-L-alanine amidase